ncbi:glycosyltransferase family 4 protein [Paludibaculum fermentans]|uniref:glycosyltransferase family 4 protein n=1 Tax=Paludibaculum fermentans TaxID=1473598 RepID=UPI003EBE64E0
MTWHCQSMRILNITNQVPYPPMSGATLRVYNILRRIARKNQVYVAAFRDTDSEPEGADHLRRFCQEVVTVKRKTLRDSMHLGVAFASLLQGDPPELRLVFCKELAQEIRRLAEQIEFDVIVIDHGSMGMYVDALPEHLRKRAVWILHDIDFEKFKQIARIEQDKVAKARAWVHAATMRRWQPAFASRFGACVVMSEADRRLLLLTNADLSVAVSPNGVDTEYCRPLPGNGDSNEMLLIGNMAYQPNIDAAVYFCKEVLPLIRKDVADAKARIVGINAGATVRGLEGNGIFVTGGVPEVEPYYKKAKVCVVPLRAGSGTRLKVLEAMAFGRPVVSTSIGCEGLGVVDGEHILLADGSKRFAEQSIKLLTQNELRMRIASSARQFVVASYDWNIIADKLMVDLEGLMG